MTHPWIKGFAIVVLSVFYGGVAVYFVRVLWKRKCASSFDEWETYHNKLKHFLTSIGLAITGVLVLVIALWLDKHGSIVLKWIVGELGIRKIQFLVAMGVVVLGMIAHYFKGSYQMQYGSTEIIFGLVASIIAVKHVDVDKFFPTLATLGGCVYIVARGCNNLFEGISKMKVPNPYLDRWKVERRWLERHMNREAKRRSR